MNIEDRPSPDELLKAISQEERSSKMGHLKIFLGMAAGVGKTYSMLEEAQVMKREGVNLYVGTINTHGRGETADLVKGLNFVPEKKIIYKEREFYELDIDRILEIKPDLILIDELAHTNVPGSRHLKRWEDVIEILENGIDVYTTLNVQHIESLNDVIEGISGISVRETVPDLIVERATYIQLIDLTPEELLERLKEGKVYLGEQSKVAALHFFQKDTLTALREIVLRYTAEKVDKDLHKMVSSAERVHEWKPRDKLLVAVSHDEHAQKLIRVTRRLAFHLDGPWIAVHVNTGKILNETSARQLEKNLALARELGAEVITIDSVDIEEGLERISKERGITQIVLGRSTKRHFFRQSLIEKIAKSCPNIDVHVVKNEKDISASEKSPYIFKKEKITRSFLIVFFVVIALSLVSQSLLPIIGYKAIGFIFLLAILVLSLFFRKGPLFFAAILFGLIWDFSFMPPINQFSFGLTEDSAILVLYICTAFATGILVDRTRKHKEMLEKRDRSSRALYDIVRYIASAPSKDIIFGSITARLERLFNGSFNLLIKSVDDKLDLDPLPSLLTDEKEKSAAIWVFENGKEAGISTNTLPSSKNLYIPLKGFHEVDGVLVYKPKEGPSISLEDKNFFYTVSQLLANFIERTISEEKARKVENFNLEEEVYKTVLKSISHEMHSPLVSMQEAIYEAIQVLQYEQAPSQKKVVEKKIHKIADSSKGLTRILESVSAMAKLSGRLIPISKEKRDISEVVSSCCKKMEKLLFGRDLKIKIQDNLPQVAFDFSLLEILLHNLLQNAIDYSELGTVILIEAKENNKVLILAVSDEGCGIPPELLETVFEKFFRIPGSSSSGLGLGLSVAKKIAEIHGGYLTAENRVPKGSKFSLFLPIL